MRNRDVMISEQREGPVAWLTFDRPE
ncbi:MAG: hypothetical protein QOE04_4972, partial [Mycobacterium sp.]|nr:hypothetical protein [Mycobacterium sp.]